MGMKAVWDEMLEESVEVPLTPAEVVKAYETGILHAAVDLALREAREEGLPSGLQTTPEEATRAVELLRLAGRYFRLKEGLADSPVLPGRRHDEWLEESGLADLVHELCDLADSPAGFAKGFSIEDIFGKAEEFVDGVARDAGILRCVARGEPHWRFCKNPLCLEPFPVPEKKGRGGAHKKQYCCEECRKKGRDLRYRRKNPYGLLSRNG